MTTDLGHFTIRPIAQGDAEEIARMAAELSAHEKSPPPLVVPDDIREELARPDCPLQGHMALRGERAVGFTLFTLSFDTESGSRGAFMCDLYVRAEARRNGLARALMAAIARDTAAQGGTWIAWGALAGNSEAQHFYATLGRVEQGVELWSVSNKVFAELKTEA